MQGFGFRVQGLGCFRWPPWPSWSERLSLRGSVLLPVSRRRTRPCGRVQVPDQRTSRVGLYWRIGSCPLGRVGFKASISAPPPPPVTRTSSKGIGAGDAVRRQMRVFSATLHTESGQKGGASGHGRSGTQKQHWKDQDQERMPSPKVHSPVEVKVRELDLARD